MIRFVNAKINIGLGVVRRRADGYHDLETIFYPVGLHNGTPVNPEAFSDVLEITTGAACDSFSSRGDVIECPPEKNLVWKAMKAFREYVAMHNPATMLSEGFDILLDKHLPSQAGLGGGSADAAFTVAMLNELSGSPLGEAEMIEITAKLGADCPFFIRNTPSIATGIGEKLSPVEDKLKGMWCVIVKPLENISTKEAFANVTPSGTEGTLLPLYSLDVDKWRGCVVNDFERSFFLMHPHCREIKNSLYANGAVYASLSGSGSAFYGIFADLQTAKNALNNINTPYKTIALL